MPAPQIAQSPAPTAHTGEKEWVWIPLTWTWRWPAHHWTRSNVSPGSAGPQLVVLAHPGRKWSLGCWTPHLAAHCLSGKRKGQFPWRRKKNHKTLSEAFLTKVRDWSQATVLEKHDSPMLPPALTLLLSVLSCICLLCLINFTSVRQMENCLNTHTKSGEVMLLKYSFFEPHLTQVKHFFPAYAWELWLQKKMENPWLTALLSLAWGGTAISARVSHLYWTACQCRGCSTKKMNCMYSSNPSHLILACLATVQHLVSTEIDTGVDHIQNPPVFERWLHSTSHHWDWTRFFLRFPQLEELCQVLIPPLASQHPPRAPSQRCSRLCSAIQQVPQPIPGSTPCSIGGVALNEQVIVLCWALFRDCVLVPDPDWIS